MANGSSCSGFNLVRNLYWNWPLFPGTGLLLGCVGTQSSLYLWLFYSILQAHAQPWTCSAEKAMQCCRALTRLFHDLSFPQMGDKYLNLSQTHIKPGNTLNSSRGRKWEQIDLQGWSEHIWYLQLCCPFVVHSLAKSNVLQ